VKRRIEIPEKMVSAVCQFIDLSCSDGSGYGQFVEGGKTYFVPTSDADYVLVKCKFGGKQWKF